MTNTIERSHLETGGRIETFDEPAERHRVAGVLAIVGAIAMGVGGGVFSSSGADLWGLVDGDVDVTSYLNDAAASASTLHAAHAIWIAGVLTLALAGVLLAGRRTDATSAAARATYTLGAALAIPGFMSMVALTRLAESGSDAPALAETLAFLGARLDDVATTVILGLGTVLLTLANHQTWMPRWLAGFGMVCGAVGLISMISIFFGEVATIGFLIVPVGIIWTVAAGIVTIRRSGPGAV